MLKRIALYWYGAKITYGIECLTNTKQKLSEILDLDPNASINALIKLSGLFSIIKRQLHVRDQVYFHRTHPSRGGLEQKNPKKVCSQWNTRITDTIRLLHGLSQDTGLRLHDGLGPAGPEGLRRVLRTIPEGKGGVGLAMSSQWTLETHTMPNSL